MHPKTLEYYLLNADSFSAYVRYYLFTKGTVSAISD